MMLQVTPLNAAHRAAGARMVDFGDWDMPVYYGSQIEEHHAVRNDCGMFDVSHMCVVDLQGTNARAFLRGLLVSGQQAQFLGLILRKKGGVLRARQKIVTDKGQGEITSCTFSPTLQQAIALARLPLGVALGGTVEVDIRAKKLTAVAVNLPFVRHGKILVS
ncbi:MAG: hypothetical protein GZ090_15600 [Oxalobacteraceae bacterium]|nr:hypothetical protein [Oxalobacteraceae bacterium]